MIFNKPDTDVVKELHNLVGVSYYQNNDFSAIRPHIIDETRTIIRYIGREVYDVAENHYFDNYDPNWSDDRTEGADHTNDKLVSLVQTAIALMAVFRYNQANIMSHEDTGRKIKIDEKNEKMPWEWMFDRDDAALLRRAFIAIDTLIEFLENAEINEWMQSEKRNRCRSLFISTWAEFEQTYPIDESPRFFYELAPFIREAQEFSLLNAMTQEKYNDLLDKYMRNTGMNESEKHLLSLIRTYLVLRTIETACLRLAVNVFPEGVVQRFFEKNGTRSSKVTPDETRREYARTIGRQADQALDNIKRYIQQITSDQLLYPIIPKNNSRNKFFIT